MLGFIKDRRQILGEGLLMKNVLEKRRKHPKNCDEQKFSTTLYW